VALLAAWRRGEQVNPVTEVSEHLKAVAFALSRGDSADATFHLEAALPIASPLQIGAIRSALGLILDGQLERAAEIVAAVLQGPAPGDPAQGLTLFAANCEVCHGVGAAGGIGPTLVDNPFIQSLTDEALLSFVLVGRPQLGMPPWEGRLTPDEIQNIIALLRTLQQ
jgi:mono/diheme cytochrome c family protein